MTEPVPSSWWDIGERIEAMCMALPEVTMRSHGWPRLFNIRRDTFCLLSAREEADGRFVPMVVLRTDPEERKVLLAIGPPYYDSRAGFGRIEVVLNNNTDWEEIRELLTESYCTLAPKKLIALLDSREDPVHRHDR
jgi:hypothetical protein